MCCRGGIDKAPKAPKGSFVSAASLPDTFHLSGYKANPGRIATAKKPTAPSVPQNEQEAKIETVGSASRQTLGDYEKTPPKAFRSLDRLHEHMTKGRTAPVATKKQPSFDYAQGGQPQSSFLNKDASAKRSSDKPSFDYDFDWMSDLPSPSALLGKPLEKANPLPGHTSTGFPSPSALIRQNDAATGIVPDNNFLEGFDLSQFNDDGSDLEAAMVGLSDSVIMQEDLQVQAASAQTSQAEAFTHWSPPPEKPTPKLYHPPTFKAESAGTPKLFLSTGCAKKFAEPAQKRKAGVRDQVEDLAQSGPVPKRPRVSDERDQAPRPPSSAEKQAKPAGPIIKPGQPAWVYEMDAAFVAEWQDVVDFV